MIIHNLKVALRNLNKYKLQTLVGILSIAVGIVTLSFSHSLIECFRLPALYQEPYHDRVYNVFFHNKADGEMMRINKEIITAIQRDGGLNTVERMTIPNGIVWQSEAEYHLKDSSIRRGVAEVCAIEPGYVNFFGIRSAITGEKIKVLKQGEAVISEDFAKEIFKDKDPIGAVQMKTNQYQTIPVTIVDVFKSISNNELRMSSLYNTTFLYCGGETFEDIVEEGQSYAVLINMILKEGRSEQELQKEINEKVEPLGYDVRIEKTINEETLELMILLKILIYLISSLILLAALIGYFRVQIQLLWVRRRELSLRIVNGADRKKIFGMLLTEMAIPIIIAMILALGLGLLLEDFVTNDLNRLVSWINIRVDGLWKFSVFVGCGLFLITALIIMITLLRPDRNRDGLASNMRRNRNHFFRYVAISLQIIISMLFVSCTFLSIEYSKKGCKFLQIPENNDFYRECLTLNLLLVQKPDQIMEEVKKLPELEKIIICGRIHTSPYEIQEIPEAREKLNGAIYFQTYFTNDTTLLSFLGLEVEWFDTDVEHDRFILISEKLYNKLTELEVLNTNSFSIYTGKMGESLPISGIVKNIPYDIGGESLIACTPNLGEVYKEYILQPKPGKGKTLKQRVDEIVSMNEPELFNKLTKNFLATYSGSFLMVDALLKGIMILGIVSLIICGMSIYSAIALETRSRLKEVAIRKVNGAKRKDIYAMFGRIYFVLIVVSSIIAVPLCLEINKLMYMLFDTFVISETIKPALSVVGSISSVTLLIFLIISVQIQKVMKVDPAKIIAKE